MNIKNMKSLLIIATLSATVGITAAFAAEPTDTPNRYNSEPIHEPEFYGSATSTIASGVSVPGGAAYLYTSGTVPSIINREGKTVYERYGDTKTQAVSVLKSIEKQLADKGLSMKDVVYLRAYLTADAAKEGKFDYTGWNEAYAQFFNNEANPVKPARSTVGVASLVSADWLIEIEAVAVYPKKHNQD